MKKYNIYISPKAAEDIQNLADTIIFDYKSPHTAQVYVKGLYDAIVNLSSIGESLHIQTNRHFMQYGNNVRRLNYKKMAIIYTTHDDLIYIHRIIPASLIIEL